MNHPTDMTVSVATFVSIAHGGGDNRTEPSVAIDTGSPLQDLRFLFAFAPAAVFPIGEACS